MNLPSHSYMSDPDVALMLEFQRGSPSAFEALLKKYYPRVLNFICRYGVNRHTAEDLTQEVFLKAYRHASGYRPAAKFQTWLFTIARNAALNSQRNERRDHVPVDGQADTQDGAVNWTVADPHQKTACEVLIDDERRCVIEAAIHALPEQQRTAVLLKRYEAMSYEEIARVMNCSVMAVKSLLNRAKESLQKKLADVHTPT